MLVKRTYQWTDHHVRCDRCHRTSVGMDQRNMVRLAARASGWIRLDTGLGSLDLCPACKQAYAQLYPHLVEDTVRYGYQ